MKLNPQRFRLALAVSATFAVFAISVSPAFAAYRAWYSPWDYVGQFEAEDVSEDTTKLLPPPGACGYKIFNPDWYRWVDSYGNTVEDEEGDDEAGDLSLDVIIWLGDPGCSQPFSTVTSGNGGGQTIELPEAGAIYLEIIGADGAYWVNDAGCHVSGCGGVDTPFDDEATLAPETYEFIPVVSAFKAVTASIVDPDRQPRAFTAIATLSNDVVELQSRLQALIGDRRRSPLGVLESSVRSLEDAAKQALAAARSSAATCERQARQYAYSDAFVACTTAGQLIEHSAALIQTATSLSR